MTLSAGELVERIHAAERRFVLATAGGGNRAIGWLTDVPGASKTLIEAIVPYSAEAMTDWLGGTPDQFCSADAARSMAMAAFFSAVKLVDGEPLPAGAACTAALASDRPKRGEHRIHLALQTEEATTAWSLVLQKDRRGRSEEEDVAARLFVNLIAHGCGLTEQIDVDLLDSEQIERTETVAEKPWQDLLLGRATGISAIGNVESPKVVFPGSFNPLHRGHRRMIEIAEQELGVRPVVEISILNVDKPPLDYTRIQRRLAQFAADRPVWLTRTARFSEKAELFPGATFIIGADTLERIGNPAYYGGDEGAWLTAIGRIVDRGCRFLVFGRDSGGGFLGLDDINLPERLKAVCRQIPKEQFDDRVSSTSLRRES